MTEDSKATFTIELTAEEIIKAVWALAVVVELDCGADDRSWNGTSSTS
jgi:hypothetical protein